MDKKCVQCGGKVYSFQFGELCYNCKEIERLENLKTEILAGEVVETDGERDIICPWCGSVYDVREMDDYEILYNDGQHEMDCDDCGKTFLVNTEVSYSYGTERKGDDHGQED